MFDGLINDFIKNAEKIGTLSAQAIMGFFTILLIAYIAWDTKSKKISNDLILQMRIKDAESDVLMSKAFEKLADEFKEFRRIIKCRGSNDV